MDDGAMIRWKRTFEGVNHGKRDKIHDSLLLGAINLIGCNWISKGFQLIWNQSKDLLIARVSF